MYKQSVQGVQGTHWRTAKCDRGGSKIQMRVGSGARAGRLGLRARSGCGSLEVAAILARRTRRQSREVYCARSGT